MDELIVIEKNQKGKPSLLYDGHRYNKSTHKNKNRTILWRCVKRSTCYASITTDKTVSNILRQSRHSCQRVPLENECFSMMNKTKKELCDTLGSMQGIFEKKFSSLQNCGDGHVPSFSSKKDTLLRTVKKYLKAKKLVFNTTDDVFIPKALSDKFLISDDDGTNKILVFATKAARQELKSSKSKFYFGDATFKCVPKPYYQLYTIHVDLNSDDHSTNVVPVIFALMANKEQSSYVRLFETIKNHGIDLKTYKCDYEIAQINAYHQVFPNGTLSGCYHHYNAAVFKKAKSLHGKTSAERMVVRKTAILPLLPPNKILEAWLEIAESAPATNNMRAFKKYFAKTWYPQHSAEVLSCAYQRHRTTNAVEGWHRRLQVKIPKKISLLFFLHRLRKEADISDSKINRSFFEPASKNRRRRDMVFDKKYKEKLQKLAGNQITISQFLYQMIYTRLSL